MKLVSILCLAVVLLLQGCRKQDASSAQVLRTDVGPISRRLPEFGELQSVFWNSELISKDSRLSPPAIEQTYRLRGFVYLSKERFAKLVSQFEWQTMSNGWKPSLVVTNEELKSVQWWHSVVFTTKMKPAEFPGDLFLNTNEAVIFFDFEANH